VEDTNLFRVLEVNSEAVTLNPIFSEDGVLRDRDEPTLTVTITDSETDTGQVVSLLEPGHVINAAIEHSPEPRFTAIEHRGGFDLIELDSRTVPYIITEFWAQEESPSKDELRGESLSVPLDAVSGEFTTQAPSAELHIQFASDTPDHSWEDFTQGNSSESVYGAFDTRDGRPTEVFIGNPDGEQYWYAILFDADQTRVAKQTRAQFGYLYDDQYISNPAWDLSHIINAAELPDEPDENPKAIFHPEYNVHSSKIPSRFGSDTVQLIAEFLFVGTQFEMSFSNQSLDHLDPDQALTTTVEELGSQSPDIISMYKFYVSLLTGIYEVVQDNPDTEIETLVNNGVIPQPDVLYRAHHQLISLIHGIESYFEKMRQVPIEKYVVDAFSGDIPGEEEFKKKYNISGFPLTIRFVLRDLEYQVDDIKEILKVSGYIADVEQTESGLAYNIMAEEKAYNFAKKHQDTISDNMTPDEFGGESRGVFLTMFGRLEQRYNWIEPSSMGPVGELFSSFTDELK
jgi:hypothetical protein